MEHADRHGTPFQYYPCSRTLGFKGLLYSVDAPNFATWLATQQSNITIEHCRHWYVDVNRIALDFEKERMSFIFKVDTKWRRLQRWMRAVATKLKQQRALAFAMAWHQRLGTGSAISIIPPELARGFFPQH